MSELFKTRRVTSSAISPSEDLNTHVAAPDPHPQYLTEEEVVGIITGGTIDLHGYVRVDVFGSTVSALESRISTNKTNLDNLTITVNGHTGDLVTLKNSVSNHTAKYAQTYGGTIPVHLDQDNQELFARRVHSHNAVDIGASVFNHNHDALYLSVHDIDTPRDIKYYAWVKSDDPTAIVYTMSTSLDYTAPSVNDFIYSDTTGNSSDIIGGVTSIVLDTDDAFYGFVFNGSTYTKHMVDNEWDTYTTTINSLNTTFANIDHSHSEYVTNVDLENTGIYPEAKNAAVDDHGDETEIVDCNDYRKQGIYSFIPLEGRTIYNTPLNDVGGVCFVTGSPKEEVSAETSELILFQWSDGNTTLYTESEAPEEGDSVYNVTAITENETVPAGSVASFDEMTTPASIVVGATTYSKVVDSESESVTVTGSKTTKTTKKISDHVTQIFMGNDGRIYNRQLEVAESALFMWSADEDPWEVYSQSETPSIGDPVYNSTTFTSKNLIGFITSYTPPSENSDASIVVNGVTFNGPNRDAYSGEVIIEDSGWHEAIRSGLQESKTDCVSYVIETGHNQANTAFYRKYSDGYIEQWGEISGNTTELRYEEFVIPYTSTNYSISFTHCDSGVGTTLTFETEFIYDKSTNEKFCYRSTDTDPDNKIRWRTEGY